MTDEKFIEVAEKLNEKMLFPPLQHYKDLYNTKITTWGRGDASMWFVTYYRREDGTIRKIEVHRKYFGVQAEKADLINEMLEKELSIEKILKTKLRYPKNIHVNP